MAVLSRFAGNPPAARQGGRLVSAGWKMRDGLRRPYEWLPAFFISVLLVSGSALSPPCLAQTAESTSAERSVKAAFLYKFLNYVDWPAEAEPSSPMTIGVIGADDIAADLGRITQGRTINNRAIRVRQIRDGDNVTGVHLLFIAGTDSARLRRQLAAIQQRPVLVVTESEGALGMGSVINFRLVEDRVRFDISLEAAEKNSLKLSSRLLTVALNVHKGQP